jgi:hypothetical protein
MSTIAVPQLLTGDVFDAQFCHAELERFYGYWVDSTTYDRIVTNSENARIGEVNMMGFWGISGFGRSGLF